MPGTFVFKPIEANLTHNTEWIGKMDPYCAFIVGNKRINTQVCKKGGKHPHWNDSISIPITTESNITVELMDKDKITKDDHIGSFMVDLTEIESTGKLSKWYPVYYKNRPAGEILLETVVEGWQGGNLNTGMTTTTTNVGTGLIGSEDYVEREKGTGFISNENYGSEHVVAESELLAAEKRLSTENRFSEENRHTVESHTGHVFQEQRQTVEPHTFMKEVDVVETRPVQKEIEVLEPHKVLKEVQYTEPVHVKKTIEVVEPKVVTKEVEVVEPRLVTKQIQVIENVPVMKKVDVIESVPIMQEVDVVEPQTFTKQVEITEQVPVTRQVTVTEPVHVKKPVEFVEPIITTQTIYKETQPTVIVDEKITTEVGPATLVDIQTQQRLSQEFTTSTSHTTDARWSGMNLTKEQIRERERLEREGVTSEWIKEPLREKNLSQGQIAERERLAREGVATESISGTGYNQSTVPKTGSGSQKKTSTFNERW